MPSSEAASSAILSARLSSHRTRQENQSNKVLKLMHSCRHSESTTTPLPILSAVSRRNECASRASAFMVVIPGGGGGSMNAAASSAVVHGKHCVTA